MKNLHPNPPHFGKVFIELNMKEITSRFLRFGFNTTEGRRARSTHPHSRRTPIGN